jgi:putative heme-binding domain-containing protein
VVTKTLALLDKAPTQEEQIFYIFHLRKLTNGWTMDQRAHYFSWFNSHRPGAEGEPTYWKGKSYYPWSKKDHKGLEHSPELLKWFTDADREYGDGSSYPKFIANFRKDAIESLNDSELNELDPFINPHGNAPSLAVSDNHKFVKEWTVEELQPLLDQVGKGRDFLKGKAAFTAAQCIQCHRFADAGGAVGPELTAVSSRYTRRDILDSILLPSKVISEQYQNTRFIKRDGDEVTGRIVEENDDKVVVATNPLSDAKVEVKKADIEKRVPSAVSPMPEGLVNNLTQDEILDLLAYLESGGKADAAAFKKVEAKESKVEPTSPEKSHEHPLGQESQSR